MKKRKKTIYAILLLMIILCVVGIVKHNKKDDSKKNIKYGNIEEYVPEKELAKDKATNSSKDNPNKTKYLPGENEDEMPDFNYAEKAARDNDYNLTKFVTVYNTDEEEFKLAHCMYYKANKELVLRAHIYNLTDNRKKKITLVALDQKGKVVTSGEVFQNSKANAKVYFTIKAPIYRDECFAEDIVKIELYAEPVEVDKFAF